MWCEHRVRVGYLQQQRELTEVRNEGLLPVGMNAQCQQHVLRRLDRAFQAFFYRCKNGEKPGYPRFRSYSRYGSLTWSCGPGGNGCQIRRDGKLTLQGVGVIRVRWHRCFPEGSQLKQTTIKRKAGRWYVYFSLDNVPVRPLPVIDQSIGIDLGITTFARLSNGESIKGPRAERAAAARVRRAQRKVSRRKQGSRRRQKAITLLARHKAREKDRRRDHAHREARKLVSRFDVIAAEDLNYHGLARGMLARDVHDQGWSQFVQLLTEKAEEAARKVVLVDPRNTSQICSECLAYVPKALGVRTHICACGYKTDRDTNAARNILKLGLGQSLQTPTCEEQVQCVV